MIDDDQFFQTRGEMDTGHAILSMDFA